MEAIDKELQEASRSPSTSDLHSMSVRVKGKGKGKQQQQKRKKVEQEGVDEKAFDEVCVDMESCIVCVQLVQ